MNYFDNIRNMDMVTAVLGLGALAQESRLTIYRLLVEHGKAGLCVGDIGAEAKIAPATLSFHLKELTRAGLVKSRRDGRSIYYTSDFDAINALVAYVTENCCGGVDCGMTRPLKKSKRKSKSNIR